MKQNVYTTNDIQLSFVERAVALFSPRRANQLIQQKAAIQYLNGLSQRGAFQASETTRHNNNWFASETDINLVLQSELPTMRKRNRWLCRNNPYAKSALNTFMNYCVGVGFDLQMAVAKTVKTANGYQVVEMDALNDYVEDKYSEWGEDVHVAASESTPDSFSDCQWMGLQRWIEDGECAIHLIPTKGKVLQLEFIEPEAFDTFKTEYNGNPVILGVEVDRKTWKPVAYWIRSADPRLTGYVWQNESVRIPASRFIHSFIRQYPRQMRGLPWFHAVTEKLFQVEESDNAHLVREKIGAMLGVLFTGFNSESGPIASDDVTSGPGGAAGAPVDANGTPIRNLAPGMMAFGPDGATASVINPTSPDSTHDQFKKSNLIACGAGMQFGMSYQGLTRDTSNVTFSSGRAAGQMDMQGYRPIQKLIGRKMLSPIFRTWMDLSVDAGDLFDTSATRVDYMLRPKFWQKHAWLPGGWSWGINPVQEVQAAKDSMAAFITTLQDECSALGLDWKVQLRKAAKSKAFAESLGLKLNAQEQPAEPTDTQLQAEQDNTDATVKTGALAPYQ